MTKFLNSHPMNNYLSFFSQGRLFGLVGLLSITLSTQAQQLPDLSLADIQGKEQQISRLAQPEKPTLVVFWAAWVPESIEAIEALRKQAWNAKLIAVSIDRDRGKAEVQRVAKEYGWTFDLLMDNELTLKHKLNVVNVPHVFLFNPKGELTYQLAALGKENMGTLQEKIAALQDDK